MLIDVKECVDHTYNGICERAIAHILGQLSGLPATDFSTGPRGEYDWLQGELPMELKLSSSFKIPVELSKDREGLIPSGVAITKAPYVLMICNGHAKKDGKTVAVAKVRLFPTKWLIRTACAIEPTPYEGLTESQHSFVHYIKGPWHNNDIWLGDMDYVKSGDKWLIDTDSFRPTKFAGGALRTLEQEYRDGTFN